MKLFFFGLFLTVLLYSPVLKAGFVYDDVWYLTGNPAVRTLDVVSFFRDPATAAAPESGLASDVYRPLGTLAFAILFKFWGLHPGPYHALMILLHILNGILLWKVLSRLLGDPVSAGIGALVFLWHPVQVQSVAWVCQLTGLFAATGCLFALLMFLEAERASFSRVLAGWAAFLMAVFSKETAIVLPGIAAMFWDRSSKRLFRVGLGLVWIALFYALTRQTVLHHVSQFPQADASSAASWTLGLLAFPVYIAKILIPVSLRVSYAYPTETPWLVFGAGTFLIAYVAGIFWLRRRCLPVAQAMGWILIGLLPFLQIVPIRAFVAERFLYIPLMGAAYLAGWIWNHYSQARRWMLLWLGFLAVQTAMVVPAWRSEQTLWAEAARREPQNAFAHACYAQTLGESPAAEREYFKVLVNRPSVGVRYAAYQNLASLHHTWGHTWKANYWKRLADKGRPQ